MRVIFKIVSKLYEIILRTFYPISLQYFCKAFAARIYPETSVVKECELEVFIPFRDKWDLTKLCLESLVRQRNISIKITVHLIDNGSSDLTQSSIQSWIDTNKSSVNWQSHRIDEAFNFSKLCNIALTLSAPIHAERYFLFLNNDVVLTNKDTLVTSVQFFQNSSDCGAVGITLLYPNRKIQHLFAAPGVKIIAAHPYKNKSTSILGEWNKMARKVPAITGAYLMVEAKRFHEVGGYDENLPTAGQDIDLCLKLQKKGWGCWVLPKIQALHLESASRSKSRINRAEVDYMYHKWQDTLTKHPDYPKEISRWSEQPVRRLREGRYPYELTI